MVRYSIIGFSREPGLWLRTPGHKEIHSKERDRQKGPFYCVVNGTFTADQGSQSEPEVNKLGGHPGKPVGYCGRKAVERGIGKGIQKWGWKRA